MSEHRQEDLFGLPSIVKPKPETDPRAIHWGDLYIHQPIAPDEALRLLRVPRKNGRLADWRDWAAARAGLDVERFCRALDWEVNILGNKSLALFIWRIA